MLKIREFRLAKSFTQEQLSELVGVSRVNISRYENGNREPPINVLAKIATALEVMLDDLVDKTA